ncbi:MAG: SEC-C metal-binding domain-containing protein, partial [Planctomycetota bacterium]|nr:SEC-C metal-binding domain-containing protein [Planctomycetota bacterium]
VSNAIARAQRKVEDRNFEIRKSLLEYDEVMDTQRKTIYGVRQEVLEGEGLKEKVLTMIEGCLERSVKVHADDAAGLTEWCLRTFGMEIKGSSAELACDSEVHDIAPLMEEIKARYEAREAQWGDDLARRIENYILLNAIDSRWKDHLKAIDALKVGIGLRSYGQEDPKTAYKKEGTELFQDHLLPSIENEVSSLILRIEVQQPEEPEAVEAQSASAGSPDGALQPKGMGGGSPGPAPQGGQGSNAPQQLTPEQVELLKSRARKQVAQQAMSQPGVAASNAFDVMRRNKAMAEAQAAQKAKAEGKPAPAPAAPRTQASAGFEGVGRNDECPCGSGKKFKKCHGR